MAFDVHFHCEPAEQAYGGNDVLEMEFPKSASFINFERVGNGQDY